MKKLLIILLLCTGALPAAARYNEIPYGRNIFAVLPAWTQTNYGIGISYERFLDSKSVMSFCLPVIVVPGGYGWTGPASNVMVMPGLKFYTTGSDGRFYHALGPAISVTTPGQDIDVDLAMMMITNSLGVNIGRSISIGIEFGIGTSFIIFLGDADYVLQYAGSLKAGWRF